jgi:CHAT domain-containing protein
VGAAGRTRAPAVLLLTEELAVPWELAAFEPELTSSWGGTSPFLGAHVAVSRWPLSEHKPRPHPRSSVAVRTGAVLTADYTGVSGWGRLESAVTEAGEVAAMFDPPATTVAPEMWAVIDLFRGRPPGDVLHVALHGQYDGQGDQEGIVLLAKSPAGGATAQFLTPAELENGELDHGPFVFLNACQVGTDERVLGDYGGFASTLLRIGAVGVVAPLWNVKDDVAGAFARQFYAATLPRDPGVEPVPVAEAVRALRAAYTEEAVRAGTPGLHATHVAYQVFGHPRLRLTRTPDGQHD